MEKIQGTAEDDENADSPEADEKGKAKKKKKKEVEVVPRDLPEVTAWKKIAVSVSGPLGNVLLAIIIAWAVYLVGMPMNRAVQETTLGFVEEASQAYDKGLREGDKILSVNGAGVETWGLMMQEVAMNKGKAGVQIKAEAADGSVKEMILDTEDIGYYGIAMIPGIEPVDPEIDTLVDEVIPGMAAEAAGMKAGDIIKSIGGVPVEVSTQVTDLVKQNKDQPVIVQVERMVDGEAKLMDFTMTPKYDKARDQVMIGIRYSAEMAEVIVHPKPSTQIKQHSMAIFRLLRDLVDPKKSKTAAKMVGGPVSIISSYTTIIKSSFMLAIWFTGFLNINLAILNLMPLPVLDGGHIMFALYEAITRRKPHPKFVAVLINTFVVILIGLFVLLSVRDVDRSTPLGGFVRGFFEKNNTNDVEQVESP
ncbi:RIP metalloprotease RseP [bacterium E08(2017)]|nr:RIP metalloprotease RseP [bacterium E08(2017)]